MVTLLLVICVLAVTLTYLARYLLWVRRAARMTSNIPGPKPLPILGNALHFYGAQSTEAIFRVLTSLDRCYSEPKNKIMKLWFGPNLVIAVGDPYHIDTVLSSSDALHKGYIYNGFRLVGNGVFVQNGEKWKELRKPLNKMMHRKKLESSLGLFYEKSKTVCKIWNKSAAEAATVDLKDSLTNYAVDTMAEFSFGYDTNVLEDDHLNSSIRLTKSIEIAHKLLYKFPYNVTTEFPTLFPGVNKIDRLMGPIWIALAQMMENRSQLRVETEETTDEKFSDYLAQVAKRNNFNQLQTGKLAADYFIAGLDTTSVSSSSILLMLAMHPEYQEAVYREQIEILGKEPDVAPTWQQLNDMSYLSRVIKEVMRFFGPLGLSRKVTNDVKLGDYVLPKGCTAYISLYQLHRNPEFWSHPNQFYPDHFLPEAIASRPKQAYLPFSSGPRGCPGALFSMVILKTLISTLIRTFKFETDLNFDELDYKYILMLEVGQGYQVRIIPRN